MCSFTGSLRFLYLKEEGTNGNILSGNLLIANQLFFIVRSVATKCPPG